MKPTNKNSTQDKEKKQNKQKKQKPECKTKYQNGTQDNIKNK